jgi:uncharacterized protein (DUF1684 family)
MKKGDAFWRIQARREAYKQKMNDPATPDNLEVRGVLITKWKAGEITFEEMQAEVTRLKKLRSRK